MQEVIIFLARFLIYIPILAVSALAFKLRSKKLFLQLAFSIFLIEILSEVAKLLVSIKRPFVELGLPNPGVWLPFSENSFFSSHVGVAFAVGTVIWKQNKLLSISCFIFGVVIGVLRVIIKVHYPIDIVGGMFFGILVGFLIRLLLCRYFNPLY